MARTRRTVSKAWGGALEQALVDQGYIYFEIDNRGSANRGVAFESAIYRAMGSVEVQDQKAGAEFLKRCPSSIRARSRSMAGPTADT